MKNIGQLLGKKKMITRKTLDEKSVFYVFQLLIKDEYGKQGAQHIKPVYLNKNIIFLEVVGSTWTGEISLNKSYILAKLNEQLGADSIRDLVISN
ncbi:MAG TPA: DciA family protein [Patescibacteria group bacterium]